MKQIIRLESLSAFYGEKQVLHQISTGIDSHEITAIIGPSGCGKTTLLQCLNRLIEEIPDTSWQGNIFLKDQLLSTIPKEQLRRQVGILFQTPTPFPFSVMKNLTFAPQYFGGRTRKQQEQFAIEKLKQCHLYDEVKEDLHKSALKLSGGQQQRLCLARALTAEPEVLLLDEPCSALDVQSTQKIETLLQEIKKEYTIVIVTHNLAQARRLADRTLFLYNGSLWEEGTHLFENPQRQETKDFIAGVMG